MFLCGRERGREGGTRGEEIGWMEGGRERRKKDEEEDKLAE